MIRIFNCAKKQRNQIAGFASCLQRIVPVPRDTFSIQVSKYGVDTEYYRHLYFMAAVGGSPPAAGGRHPVLGPRGQPLSLRGKQATKSSVRPPYSSVALFPVPLLFPSGRASNHQAITPSRKLGRRHRYYVVIVASGNSPVPYHLPLPFTTPPVK